jgi:glutamate racemase
LIDTSDAVVRQLKRQLEQLQQSESTANTSESNYGSVKFVSSKDDAVLLKMAQGLMRSDLQAHQVSSSLLDVT